jgi:hypothetical protein
MAMCCGIKRAWQWVLDFWQWSQDLVQVLTSLERLCKTNLEEMIRREASLPGREILCKFKKYIFSELFRDNWEKNAYGDVSDQALSTCLLR